MSLNVNTIDSFQGGECDVLLISVVRTNGVGFLDDICRLNVALTRAKQSLIICGNFKSLKVSKKCSNKIVNIMFVFIHDYNFHVYVFRVNGYGATY
jgi:senataxin